MKFKGTRQSPEPQNIFEPGNCVVTKKRDEPVVVLITSKEGPQHFAGVVVSGNNDHPTGKHSSTFIRAYFEQYHGTIILEPCKPEQP